MTGTCLHGSLLPFDLVQLSLGPLVVYIPALPPAIPHEQVRQGEQDRHSAVRVSTGASTK
jgi:hypothetical protein